MNNSLKRLIYKCHRCGLPQQYFRTFSLHELSEEHLLLRQTCKQFAENELKPVAALLDKNSTFPQEQIQKLGKLGLLAICADPKWGGSGQNMLGLSVAVEEISRGCASTGAIVSIHNCLYINFLDRFGTHHQKQEFLKPFADGTIGCFALSEPDAGSDVGAMSTSAKLDGDYYILNGTKSWVTSAHEGKAAIIFATVDKELRHKGISAFIVPIDTPGLTIGRKEDKLGIKATSTANYFLSNVRIPRNNLIGNIGDGFKLAMMQLDRARVGIASQALGIGQAAMDIAVNYAGQRIAFGKPINQTQAVKMRLADMACRLESARLLVWRAAALCCDETVRVSKEASMAKLAASEAATAISHSAIQVLGGLGYVRDMPAERHYRDARITEIYGGITDIQKLLIGDMVIKDYAQK